MVILGLYFCKVKYEENELWNSVTFVAKTISLKQQNLHKDNSVFDKHEEKYQNTH